MRPNLKEWSLKLLSTESDMIFKYEICKIAGIYKLDVTEVVPFLSFWSEFRTSDAVPEVGTYLGTNQTPESHNLFLFDTILLLNLCII